MNWHAVELHTHTLHSDGKMTVAELLMHAKQEKLSLVALTDHNTRSGLREAGEAVIPGIEWTTYHGHMTILGDSQNIDWRDIQLSKFDEKLWAIKATGALACVAHPYRIGSPICTGCHFDYPLRDKALIPLWEVWSGENPPLLESNALSYQAWVDMLDEGFCPAAVYGRDWHVPTPAAPVAATYIGLDGPLTPGSALSALRQGRTAVTMGPMPLLRVWQHGVCYGPGDTLYPGYAKVDALLLCHLRSEVWKPYGLIVRQVRLKGAHGNTLAEQPMAATGNHFEVNLPAGPLWVEFWGEMNGKQCLLAFTNALHVRHRTMICAHAGALGEVANSIASIDAAIQAGCDIVEIDVRRLGGQLVLAHDMPRQSDAPPVTLSQCLQRVYPQPGVIVNLDMKQAGLTPEAVALAKEIGMGSRVVFTGSFNQADIAAFPERREAFWNLPLESGEESAADPEAYAKQGLDWMNLDAALIDQSLMQRAARSGIRISAWTVDSADEMLNLLTLGAGSITTNRPDIALKLRSISEGGSEH